MEKEIIIPKGSLYLPFDDLPQNCIFNKVVTGCGGTTIALFNNINYVICVPTKELIVNKLGILSAGCSSITNFDNRKIEAFGLMGTLTNEDKRNLKNYIESEGLKKIICTYDKLPFLTSMLNPKGYQLLIDEYHNILKAYSYRERALKGIIENFNLYKSVCFLSATPIKIYYTPKDLQHLDLVTAKWEESDLLKVILKPTNKPFQLAANIINIYKKNGYLEVGNFKSYEAFFFINSVTEIVNIINHCNLQKEEVRIICSSSNINKIKTLGYDICTSKDKSRLITFITSKSFEGVDYFSDNGLCFVVSNTHKKSTLVDIGTDIIQIAGRIRSANNPFRNTLYHLYNTAGIDKINQDIPIEQIREIGINEENGVLKMVEDFNALPYEERKIKRKVFTGNRYLTFNPDTCLLEANDMLMKFELYQSEIQYYTYNNGISIKSAYTENNINHLMADWTKLQAQKVKRKSFKQLCAQYLEVKNTELEEEFIKSNPLVKEAYENLGEEKIKVLKYSIPKIQKELAARMDDNDKTEQFLILLNKATPLTFLSNKEIKNILNSIAIKLKMNKRFKASDVESFYITAKGFRRLANKGINGYEILYPKFTIE